MFICTMSRRRFEILLIALSFDNDIDRAMRLKVDGAAAISELLTISIGESNRNITATTG